MKKPTLEEFKKGLEEFRKKYEESGKMDDFDFIKEVSPGCFRVGSPGNYAYTGLGGAELAKKAEESNP